MTTDGDARALDQSEPAPYFWTDEPCPHDDCDGQLQQQDDYNVMCLDCRSVFVHVAGDGHHLVDRNNQTVAKRGGSADE